MLLKVHFNTSILPSLPKCDRSLFWQIFNENTKLNSIATRGCHVFIENRNTLAESIQVSQVGRTWKLMIQTNRESSFLLYQTGIIGWIDGCWEMQFWVWVTFNSWWRNEMETFSALLSLCVGNSPLTREFPSQRPVARGFDASFDLRLNKRFNKQSKRSWFETPSRSLWRHCNVLICHEVVPHLPMSFRGEEFIQCKIYSNSPIFKALKQNIRSIGGDCNKDCPSIRSMNRNSCDKNKYHGFCRW